MTNDELRSEVIDWLRSFHIELTADDAGLLFDAIYAEFVADTAIFPTNAAFRRQLEKLHQMPRHDWSQSVQTWYPNHRYLDWYTSVSVPASL